MDKYKKFISMIALVMLFGCVQAYKQLENNRLQMGEVYSVDPKMVWNSMEIRNITLWTANGMFLDRIVFYNAVEDGQTLFKENEEEGQKFHKDMNIIEIAEFFSDSIKSSQKWSQVEVMDLRPQAFGSQEGFMFDTKIVSGKGLIYKGLTLGAVINDKLYLIQFMAVEIEYYPKYIETVKDIMASVKTE